MHVHSSAPLHTSGWCASLHHRICICNFLVFAFVLIFVFVFVTFVTQGDTVHLYQSSPVASPNCKNCPRWIHLQKMPSKMRSARIGMKALVTTSKILKRIGPNVMSQWGSIRFSTLTSIGYLQTGHWRRMSCHSNDGFSEGLKGLNIVLDWTSFRMQPPNQRYVTNKGHSR